MIRRFRLRVAISVMGLMLCPSYWKRTVQNLLREQVDRHHFVNSLWMVSSIIMVGVTSFESPNKLHGRRDDFALCDKNVSQLDTWHVRFSSRDVTACNCNWKVFGIYLHYAIHWFGVSQCDTASQACHRRSLKRIYSFHRRVYMHPCQVRWL